MSEDLKAPDSKAPDWKAPDWKAEQLAPGITVWTLPSGRTHTTTPTRYDT